MALSAAGRGTVEIELTVRAKIRFALETLVAATRRRSERTSARMPRTARWVASEPGLQIFSSWATYSGRVGSAAAATEARVTAEQAQGQDDRGAHQTPASAAEPVAGPVGAARQDALEPGGRAPDPLADQEHQRRQEDDADDGGVEQDRDGQAEAHLADGRDRGDREARRRPRP